MPNDIEAMARAAFEAHTLGVRGAYWERLDEADKQIWRERVAQRDVGERRPLSL